MIPKGIENADAIIQACKEMLTGLDKAHGEWKEVLKSVIPVLEDMKGKFYLKTNLAVPITNVCRRDAEELRSLAAAHDLARFPEVLARFRGHLETLVKQAKMEGVIIT